MVVVGRGSVLQGTVHYAECPFEYGIPSPGKHLSIRTVCTLLVWDRMHGSRVEVGWSPRIDRYERGTATPRERVRVARFHAPVGVPAKDGITTTGGLESRHRIG